jgi:hypothetical protein
LRISASPCRFGAARCVRRSGPIWALKKKLVKFIGSLEGFSTHRPPLIRDPRDEQYPYVGEDVAAFMKAEDGVPQRL